MADLSITRNYSDGNALTEAHLDAANDSIETYVNARNQGTAWDIVNVTNAALKVAGFQTYPILQIQVGTSTTAASTTNTSFTASNLSVSITPKATTSKILLFAIGTANCANGNAIYTTLARDGSNLLASDGGGTSAPNASGGTTFTVPVSLIFYDSPATTSATTYAVYFKSGNGALSVNFGAANHTQVIIAIEIAQ